jgi:hypothetical protein
MKFTEVLKKVEPSFSSVAQEFEVAEATVLRWAQGSAAPHPKVQRMVMAHVLHEKKISCDCEDHQQIERCPYHKWFE